MGASQSIDDVEQDEEESPTADYGSPPHESYNLTSVPLGPALLKPEENQFVPHLKAQSDAPNEVKSRGQQFSQAVHRHSDEALTPTRSLSSSSTSSCSSSSSTSSGHLSSTALHGSSKQPSLSSSLAGTGTGTNFSPSPSTYSSSTISLPGRPSGVPHPAPSSTPIEHSHAHSILQKSLSFQSGLISHSQPGSPRVASIQREPWTEVYLIRHGESTMNLQPTVIGGRSPGAMLTNRGRKQAQALGVFLRDYSGIKFDAIYCSPLERARATALAVCEELSVPEDQIIFSDQLVELSQGQWEGRPRTEIYTPAMLARIQAMQPDFRAPGGESQRQVEHRMVEFVNNVVLPRSSMTPGIEPIVRPDGSGASVLEASSLDATSHEPDDDSATTTAKSSGIDLPPAAFFRVGNAVIDGPLIVGSPGKSLLGGGRGGDPFGPGRASDLFGTGRGSDAWGSAHGGGEGLQTLHTSGSFGSSENVLPSSPRGPHSVNAPRGRGSAAVIKVAIFTHGMSIKCLLRSLLLSSNPNITHKINIDNTSTTVLKHNATAGWQLVKVNCVAHLLIARGPLLPAVTRSGEPPPAKPAAESS